MENKIVSIYLSLAYCAILWAACQPPPALEDGFWRLNQTLRICQKKDVTTARLAW